MFLFQKVEELITRKQDTIAVVGHFILEHRLDIEQYSMADIAKETYTSKASLVRFAQALGFSGWKEFIYAYTHEAASEKDLENRVDPNYPIEEADDSLTVVANLMSLKMQSMRDTAKLVETSDLQDAAEILFRAENIVLYGLSTNSDYASLFRRRLLAIGKSVQLAQSGDGGTLARFLGPKDCALFISYSGNLAEHYPLKWIPLLEEKQVPVIALTSGGNSYLAESADVVLPIYSREKLYSKMANFATEESILFLLDLLYATVFQLNYDHFKALKQSNALLLEKERKATVSDMSE